MFLSLMNSFSKGWAKWFHQDASLKLFSVFFAIHSHFYSNTEEPIKISLSVCSTSSDQEKSNGYMAKSFGSVTTASASISVGLAEPEPMKGMSRLISVSWRLAMNTHLFAFSQRMSFHSLLSRLTGSCRPFRRRRWRSVPSTASQTREDHQGLATQPRAHVFY